MQPRNHFKNDLTSKQYARLAEQKTSDDYVKLLKEFYPPEDVKAEELSRFIDTFGLHADLERNCSFSLQRSYTLALRVNTSKLIELYHQHWPRVKNPLTTVVNVMVNHDQIAFGLTHLELLKQAFKADPDLQKRILMQARSAEMVHILNACGATVTPGKSPLIQRIENHNKCYIGVGYVNGMYGKYIGLPSNEVIAAWVQIGAVDVVADGHTALTLIQNLSKDAPKVNRTFETYPGVFDTGSCPLPTRSEWLSLDGLLKTNGAILAANRESKRTGSGTLDICVGLNTQPSRVSQDPVPSKDKDAVVGIATVVDNGNSLSAVSVPHTNPRTLERPKMPSV